MTNQPPRFIWTVRCAWCTAADTFTTELDAQRWACTHHCAHTPPTTPAGSSNTQPRKAQP